MSAAPVLEKANEERIREIAREIAREQTEALRKEIMEGELGKLRRDLNLQMGQVWRAIGELTEAQKRTEARVEELVEAQKRTEERVGRLEAVVQELAEAQKRTEERVGRLEAVVQELAEAQKRTEERIGRLEAVVQELAEAQKRTEERVGRLEAVVQELAEAQKRTEERVGRLEEKVDKIDARVERLEEKVDKIDARVGRLEEKVDKIDVRVERLEEKVDKIGVQVGRLANQYGLELEADAAEVLYQVLTDKGYRFLEEPSGVSLNGEIDVVAHVETPDGQRLWVLVEAKARVRRKEVGRWLKKLDNEAFRKRLREQQGIEPPFLPYIYGQHVYRAAIQMAETAGLGVLDVEKERLSPKFWQ